MSKTNRPMPAFVEQAIASREWEGVPAERQVVATGGAMSCMALNMAFVMVEAAVQLEGDVDYVVVGCERFGDIRTWGIACDGRIWGAEVVRDMRVPPQFALVCSKAKGGTFSRVEVVSGM